MTPQEALDRIRQGEIAPIYLVAGEERHRVKSVVDALKQAAAENDRLGLNTDRYSAGEADAQTVLGVARTLPMMAPRRYVTVRDIERWEPKPGSKTAPHFDAILEYATNPSPSTTLVLWGGKLDPRRKLYLTAKSAGWLVVCDPLGRDELPHWLEIRARERGTQLEPGVATLLLETIGHDMAQLDDVIERVSLYVGAGQPISEAAVSECMSLARTASVWQLVGAVGRRDLATALATLERVYEPHEELRLLGVLAWSTRQLIRFEAGVAQGLAPRDAAIQAGAPPFKARELSAQLKHVRGKTLERWLVTLARVDVALKGGSKRPPRAVLEAAIVALCTGGRF